MQSINPEINDYGSFAKDTLQSIDQKVRASVGSYEMSKASNMINRKDPGN